MTVADLHTLVALRAAEAAAWEENWRRDRDHSAALRDRHEIEYDLEGAVAAVNKFFEGTLTVEPSDLRPVKRFRWEAAWEFYLPDLSHYPFQVCMNVFYGMRLMNGENAGVDSGGGEGRYLDSLADLAGVIKVPFAEAAKADFADPKRTRRHEHRFRWGRCP